jgi:hypothetical protein
VNPRLREIALKRADLASRSAYERQAFAGNKLWVSVPFLVAGPVLSVVRIIGSATFMRFAGILLFKFWPLATLRGAGRGLRLWMAADRIRKELLR